MGVLTPKVAQTMFSLSTFVAQGVALMFDALKTPPGAAGLDLSVLFRRECEGLGLRLKSSSPFASSANCTVRRAWR